jgi:hypothetical protein
VPVPAPAIPGLEGLGVPYEPLAALLFYFAESEYFRFGREGDNVESASFLNAQKKFRSAWETQLHKGPSAFTALGPLWLHTFGPADSVALMLLDEHELLPALTPVSGPKLEQVTVAFCPHVERLGIPGKILAGPDERADSPFSLPWRDLFTQGGTGQHYDVETGRPVALVTKFKVNGPVTLEHGALFERAILRAAARKILRTCRTLKDVAVARAGRQTHHGQTASYFSPSDVDAYRCFFLDVQGSEDFILLSFGTNLSVAASFVIALRCLTFGDILPADAPDDDLPIDPGDLAFRKLLEENSEGFQHRWWRLWEEYNGGKEGGEERGATESMIEALADNHVFSFVYSTPGISTKGLDDPAQITGWAEVSRLLDFSPGHGKDLLPLYTKQGGEFVSAPTGSVELDIEGVEWYTIGRHDLILSAAVLPPEGATAPKVGFAPRSVRPVPLKDFVAYWRIHFERLHLRMLAKAKSAGSTCYETGLLDQSSSLTVPIPGEGLLHAVGPRHVAHLVLLSHARDELVEELAGLPTEMKSWCGEPFLIPEWRAHRFDVETLDRCARQLGFPWPFRTRFRQLYTNFLSSFSDGVLFPIVLDLYDSLHALYYLVVVDFTQAEAESLRQGHGRAGACSSILTEDVMRMLDSFLNALEDAFTHRIARSLPNHESRELSPALRGSLTKMVSASDAVLKCGFGLVRRFLHRDEGAERRYLVAGAARMNFHTRTYLNPPLRGVRAPNSPSEQVLLARIDMNISHIFCPEELRQYFHEASHIVFQVRGGRIRALSQDVPPGHRALSADRLEEVFAELLTHFFIFRKDTGLFARFFVAEYNERRAGSDEVAVLQRFSEFMLRGFVVKSMMEAYAGESDDPCSWGDAPASATVFPPNDLAAQEDRFVEYLETYGPFFSEYWRFGPAAAAGGPWRYAREAFKLGYPRLAEFLPVVWDVALELYKEYAAAPGAEEDDGVRRLDAEASKILNDRLDRTLVNGQPCLRRDPRVPKDTPGAAPNYLAPLTFVCHLIYVYLKRHYGELDSGKILHVSQHCAAPQPPPDVTWLIDPTQPGLLCLSEGKRRDRLQYRVAFLKSLWDLSTEFRARRLCDIIQSIRGPGGRSKAPSRPNH